MGTSVLSSVCSSQAQTCIKAYECKQGSCRVRAPRKPSRGRVGCRGCSSQLVLDSTRLVGRNCIYRVQRTKQEPGRALVGDLRSLKSKGCCTVQEEMSLCLQGTAVWFGLLSSALHRLEPDRPSSGLSVTAILKVGALAWPPCQSVPVS